MFEITVMHREHIMRLTYFVSLTGIIIIKIFRKKRKIKIMISPFLNNCQCYCDQKGYGLVMSARHQLRGRVFWSRYRNATGTKPG